MIDFKEVEKDIKNILDDWVSIKNSHLSFAVAPEITDYIKTIIKNN